MLIGVIISGVMEEYTINLCKGIEQLATENDVRCVVIPGKYVGLDYETGFQNKHGYCYNSLFSYALLSCFDGLIIETASVTMYASEEEREKFIARFANIPHVFISYNKEGYSSVTIDNKAGLNDALEYTYKYGARNYAMLGGPEKSVDAAERKECFEAFIKRNNLPYSEKSYIHGSFFLDCLKEAKTLVSNNLDADVFVCANDILAKRIYDACKSYNLIPGKDVSVIGFDDSDFCISTYPTISSVRTDIVELGKESFKLLMENISGGETKQVFVPSKFILRDSICHKNVADQESIVVTCFKDIVKANVHIDENNNLAELEDNFNEIFRLMGLHEEYELARLIISINEAIDKMFLSESLKYLDWELFVNYLDDKFQEYIVEIQDTEFKQAFMEVYVDLLKKIMKCSQSLDGVRGNVNLESQYEMEAFFMKTMQIVRNTEYNYMRFLENLSFLGIQNAYMYLYENDISYVQGEQFEIPDKLLLKAVLDNGVAQILPANWQLINKEDIFDNKFLDWDGYNRLTMFPLYSENYLHGVIICDMKRVGYMQSDMFANQLSGAIRMLKLRTENNRVVNEYEESVRKLKENNITLDTMSKTDPLTGLNNRRGYYVRVEKMRELCPNEKASMLIGYADMNDLKIINDRFGHDDGDYALKSIGSLLTDFVTMYNGFAARIGGDEFAFAIGIPVGNDPEKYKKELLDSFVEFNASCNKPYNVSVSIGYYKVDLNDDISIDDALNHADEMLYTDKLQKKGSVIKK